MNINNTIKTDDAIFKALDLKTINRIICQTDKGMLSLQIRKGDTQYHLHLDSVPLEKDLNKTLMDLLFPVKQLEVPQVNKKTFFTDIGSKVIDQDGKEVDLKKIKVKIPKSKGRPKGTKNK